MKQSSSKNYFWLLACLSIAFFFLYAVFPFLSGAIFNSPDANSNFVFSKRLAEKGDLKIFEPLNRIAGDIVHPRSTNIAGPFIVPGGFLGLILIYGLLAKIVGSGALIYFTPLFAVMGVLFFYGLVRRVFDAQIAFISAFFLFIHPAFWYYASRSMMPNILFVSLLLAAFYFLLKIKEKNKWFNYCLAGAMLGLALGVRMSEAVWLALVLLILFFAYIKDIKWPSFILGCLSLLLALAPVFYFQYVTYGHPLFTGYTRLDALWQEGARAGNWLTLFFPFGIKEKFIIDNFYNYFINLFWWFALAAAAGFISSLYFFRRLHKKHKLFLLVFIFISLWLTIYYGSWLFHDNPDPNKITIGTSYVRYWLPIYILSLPLVGFFVSKFSRLLKTKKARQFFVAVFVLLLVYPSAKIVLWQTGESLFNIKNTLVLYKEVKQEIVEFSEEDSVIVSGPLDKILFPERRVVHNIVDEYNQRNLPVVLEKVPVYLYSLFPARDIEYLNERKLKKYNLDLADYQSLSDGAKLLKLKFRPNAEN